MRVLISALVGILGSTTAIAGDEVFTCRVNQRFGECLSRENAMVVAVAKAKHRVLEEVAALWISKITPPNEMLPVSKISTIHALVRGVLRGEILSQKIQFITDVPEVIVVAKVQYENKATENQVRSLNQNWRQLKRYEECHSRESDLLEAVARLEEENWKIPYIDSEGRKRKRGRLKEQFRNERRGL